MKEKIEFFLNVYESNKDFDHSIISFNNKNLFIITNEKLTISEEVYSLVTKKHLSLINGKGLKTFSVKNKNNFEFSVTDEYKTIFKER